MLPRVHGADSKHFTLCEPQGTVTMETNMPPSATAVQQVSLVTTNCCVPQISYFPHKQTVRMKMKYY